MSCEFRYDFAKVMRNCIKRCAALRCVTESCASRIKMYGAFVFNIPLRMIYVDRKRACVFVFVYTNESSVYRSLESKNLVERCALTSDPTNVSAIIII